MRHIGLIVFCAASLAIQNLAAITATKEYVDRKDAATLQAATNTLSAAIGGLAQNLATRRDKLDLAVYGYGNASVTFPDGFSIVYEWLQQYKYTAPSGGETIEFYGPISSTSEPGVKFWVPYAYKDATDFNPRNQLVWHLLCPSQESSPSSLVFQTGPSYIIGQFDSENPTLTLSLGATTGNAPTMTRPIVATGDTLAKLSQVNAAQTTADNAQANAADAKAAALAAADDVEKLNIGYTRLYNFSVGSTNANFTATNYPPTKAEADARCHFEAEPGMDFSKVPASLQLNEYRDGERRTVVDTRDWPVWYFKFKEAKLTNELARLRAENAALSNKLETAKAWANFTANGVENPLDDTVVVDRPNMWLMADYEWQKVVSGSNQCFVIRAKNVALSGGGNTNGFLEVVDAFGKPYIRINKSAETFADPVFDEIYWDKDDGAWYVVFSNKTKPTKGGANVALRGNGDGKCIFFEETDPECPAVITWPDVPESHSGHWIMKAVPKPVNGVVPTVMFFGAEIKVPGSDYVEYLKEASFGAGVRFGNNVYDYVESGDQLILRRRQ